MRTETAGILALMLILFSPLETTAAFENDNMMEISVFDEVDDGYIEFNELSVSNGRKCTKKNDIYSEPRCIKIECNKSCKEEGCKMGKCKKSKHDKIKSCYCYVDCKAPHVPAPSSPPLVQPPSSPIDSPPVRASPVSQPSGPAYPPEADFVGQPLNAESFWNEEAYEEIY